MPPKGKSSATSATRKKHARKAAATQGVAEEPQVPKEKKPKGKDKKSKKEPRKKVYIPPVKPVPVQPDPLDTLGLAQKLPPELLVVLRLLSKKDTTTKRRALEDLQTAWIARAKRGDEGEYLLYTLQDIIPVWLHHIPSLFLHPSRRIRLQAVALHSSILQLPTLRTQLLFQIREVLSADQTESILGSWCLAVHDVDRQVSSYARESWSRYVASSGPSEDKLLLDQTLSSRLWEFIHRMLLDPLGVYLYINPPQPAAPTPVSSRKGSGRGTPVKRNDEPIGRTKVDEEEEKEQDRKARLRVGAFGATDWVLSDKFSSPSHRPSGSEAIGITSHDEWLSAFANPALWTSLYPGKTPPFVDTESFGFEQPVVRKSAWNLLQLLVQKCKGHLTPLLPTLSQAVLRSAWVELDPLVRNAMWQPLLMFLKEHPIAWTLEAESEKEDEDDDSEDETTPNPQDPPTAPVPSRAYAEFLQFLAMGCNGSPVQGYPTVLIILSTVPSSVITVSSSHPLEDLFTSLWAAADARVLNSLDRIAASTAFLTSLLECLTFITRRVLNSEPDEAAGLVFGPDKPEDEDIEAAAKKLLGGQFMRAWDELSSGNLKVPGKSAGDELAKSLTSLYKLRPSMFDSAWGVISAAIEGSSFSSQDGIPAFVPEALQQFLAVLPQETVPGDAARTLVSKVIRIVLEQCVVFLDAEATEPNRAASVTGILEAFGGLLFADDKVSKDMDDLVQSRTHQLLKSAPSLVVLYLQHRNDEEICQMVWHQVLNTVASNPDHIESSLLELIGAIERKLLPGFLRPVGEELHEFTRMLLSKALVAPPNSTVVMLLRRLLSSYEYFIPRDLSESLVHRIINAFVLHLGDVLRNEETSLTPLSTPLALLRGLTEKESSAKAPVVESPTLYSHLFLLAVLLPQVCNIDGEVKAAATTVWTQWLSQASDEARQTVLVKVEGLLCELMSDRVAPTPEQILRAISESPFTTNIDVLATIFPSQDKLDGMLQALPSTPLDPSLAVVDSLVPPPTRYHPADDISPECDPQGFSIYARVVNGLLIHLADDRQTAKANVWALQHFFALAIYAEELQYLPSIESPVFSKDVSRSTLRAILDKVQQLAAYLLSSTTEEQWHSDVTQTLLTQGSTERLDGVGKLVASLVDRARHHDTVREARVLHLVLRHTFGTASKADAEQWMLVARKIEKQAPHISLSIVFSLSRYAPETTRLDRFRNELAAGTLGVPASKINTEGLWLLRKLAATAPDPESDVIFLPQPRAVNLVKACQQWISADEDLEEDVQSEMTLVFAALVPILSSVPGSHWELMFDVIENNLENSSLDDSSTFVTLARTLRLFLVVEDFATSSKILREVWEERRSASLVLIRDLIATKLENETPSTPLSVCRELALQVVQNLPTSLMTRETLPKMCHLVMDASASVQRMAYQLLQEAAKKYTEELVIEAAVDTEGTMKPELPAELLDILQRSLNHDDTEEYGQQWSGYLLAWMVALDLFTDASLKVKSGYVDQLRDLDLLGLKLLPIVFGVLNLYGGMAKAFKLDIWDVDEFYLDFYSPDTPLSLCLLTAHLYYRALLLVPSLVRAWLADCRDRQLSTAVAAYTSRHFSPALIRTELSRVKDPAAVAAAPELAGENVTVKVAAAVHEVTAAYTVDEQRLELTMKLPADWPLRTIEIRDSKLVGVTEDRWRAWVLGVQQILTFRSGSIVDGLSFFLKNVASHFEGVAECAICYSIVNATDGSLPRKPCRTCKNRFHAACLYKWFNTSHSSSCPLCRSEIMTGK